MDHRDPHSQAFFERNTSLPALWPWLCSPWHQEKEFEQKSSMEPEHMFKKFQAAV